MSVLKRLLGVDTQTMSIRKEIFAGMTTFFPMSYILSVVPTILSTTYMDKGAVFTATAIASGIATLLMAFLAKIPFALAPGIGLNTFFAFTIVQSMGYSWETALTAVLIEGILFTLLTVFKIREKIINSIPVNIRRATSGGIGLFIAFTGLANCGVIAYDPITIVKFGEVSSAAYLAIIGILMTVVFLRKKIKMGIFYSIILCTLIGIPMGVTEIPENFSFIDIPASISPVFMKFDFSSIFSFDMIIIITTLTLMDMFDTLGTLFGTSIKAGLTDSSGNIPRMKYALLADSIGTTIGAILGTSTVTSVMESTAGVAVGGRSGLTSAVTALFFFLVLFLAPLFLLVPSAATTSALIAVSFMMFTPIRHIDYKDISESLPAFMTIIMMPLCNFISDGIMIGMLSYAIIKLIHGKYKQISKTMYVLCTLFILHYLFLST